MGEIIRDKFKPNPHMIGRSAINIVKSWSSYEEALYAAIELHQWRADGYQQSGDYETAALEISMADGLIKALHLYESWRL